MLRATTSLLALLAVLSLAACGDGSDETTGGEPQGDAMKTAPPEGTGSEGGAGGRPIPNVRTCRTEAVKKRTMLAVDVSCKKAVAIAEAVAGRSECLPAAGESRSACTVGEFRCTSTTAQQGISVSCGRPGHSVGFLAKPR
jgi:hypothetical protein